MLYFSQMKVRRSFLPPSQGDPPRPPLLVAVEWAKLPLVKAALPQVLESRFLLEGATLGMSRLRKKMRFLPT
jgi:hypothetical protein